VHHCAESKRKILQKTPRCASLRGVATPHYTSQELKYPLRFPFCKTNGDRLALGILTTIRQGPYEQIKKKIQKSARD
jgi:hypothetical protein